MGEADNKKDVEPALVEVRSEFESLFGSNDSVHLQAMPQQESVADATRKYVINTKGRGTFFAIVSKPEYPLTVSRAVTKQEDAKASLGAYLGCVIETPTLQGFANGLSFGIWPYRKTLSGKLQKLWHASSLFQWLFRVTEHTARPTLASVYETPLCHFLRRSDLPEPLKETAKRALRALNQGTLSPCSIVQHGDLWHGNVLLGPAGQFSQPNPWGFYVIDWAGAEDDGFPFFDLLKLASSLGLSERQLNKEISRHSRALRIEPELAKLHFIVGLAHLGTKLDNFPEERYLALGINLHARLSAA